MRSRLSFWRLWQRGWRWLRRLALGLAGFLLVYLVVFWTLGAIPVNSGYVTPREGIPVWLISNGLHVDVAMPLTTPVHDWRPEFPPTHFRRVESWQDHVVFGWGDRGFYLDRTEVNNVHLGTALRAISYASRSAMHVEFMSEPLTLPSQCRVLLSPDRYRRLVAYVQASFARDASGRAMLIPDAGYRDTDTFYEGVGTYGLFYTCNTWVNAALRDIGVPTAAWALFAAGIMDHVQAL